MNCKGYTVGCEGLGIGDVRARGCTFPSLVLYSHAPKSPQSCQRGDDEQWQAAAQCATPSLVKQPSPTTMDYDS